MNLRLKIPQDYKSSGSKMRTGDLKTTYYVLDAQGNAMSNYSFTTRPTDAKANKLVLQERNIYGSKRVGIEQLQLVVAEPAYVSPDSPWEDVWELPAYTPISMRDYHWSWYQNRPSVPVSTYKQEIGDKRYELANHLGNVLNVVTDRKLPVADANDPTKVAYFTADVVSFADYLPFGQVMPNRHGDDNQYRYQFNGMEGDPEVKGEGNSYNFNARMYDPRIGRFLSTDNYKAKYPDISPYVAFLNNPNSFVDKSGDTVTITVSGNPVGTTMINLYSASEIKANPKLKGKQVEVPVYEVTVTNESGSSSTYFYTRISYRGTASDPSAVTKDVTYNVNKETNVQGVVKSRWKGKNNVLELRDFKNKSSQAVRGTRGMESTEETDRVAIQFHVKGASDGCLLAVGEDQFITLSYELLFDDKLKNANVGSNSSTAQSNFMNSVMTFQQQDVKEGKSDFIKIVIQPIEKPAESTTPQ